MKFHAGVCGFNGVSRDFSAARVYVVNRKDVG